MFGIRVGSEWSQQTVPLKLRSVSQMSTKKAYIPTPEQIALAAKRKAKREQLATEHAAPAATSVPSDHQGRFLSREWMQLRDPGAALLRVKIMTWNVRCSCTEYFAVSEN
jgi:hypothetical protein